MTYSYIKTPHNTFAILVTRQQNTRPIGEYQTEKSARTYVEKANASVVNRTPAPRFNPTIEYRFTLPEWWTKGK